MICPHCGVKIEELGTVTIRELEVLDLLALGKQNKEIARALGISDQTVKNHITNIMAKFSCCNRTEAVVYAIKHNLVKIN